MKTYTVNSLEWSDVVLEDGVCELRKEIPVHEGKFGLYVYQGTSLDKKYKKYPAWRLFVKVPESRVLHNNGMAEIRVTPTYPALEMFLRDVLVHEYRVDITRSRKSDFRAKNTWLRSLVWDKLLTEAQMEVGVYNIPKIYKQCAEFSESYKYLIGVNE